MVVAGNAVDDPLIGTEVGGAVDEETDTVLIEGGPLPVQAKIAAAQTGQMDLRRAEVDDRDGRLACVVVRIGLFKHFLKG